MKILFIGIFDDNEPNTAFRQAFKNVSTHYEEIAHNSFHSTLALQIEIINKCQQKYDLVFMQLQGANIINSSSLKALRRTGAFLVQWTGDARQPLPRHYIEFGKQIDLSLFTNTDDIDVMNGMGAKADYLQVSADHNIYNLGEPAKAPDIVFMGNNYPKTFALSDYRYEMVRFLKKEYGDNFGVYGANWDSDLKPMNLMFNQKEEAAVYRGCKIAINCSHYDLGRYTSDRFFRILMSGAFCLTKEFPDMSEYFGNDFDKQKLASFKSDNNFVDLKNAIDYYLQNEIVRKKIAKNGYEYAHKNWTWDNRIQELLTLIKKHELDKQLT